MTDLDWISRLEEDKVSKPTPEFEALLIQTLQDMVDEGLIEVVPGDDISGYDHPEDPFFPETSYPPISNDPVHGIDYGPCADFAPDTFGDDPEICTTCLYNVRDHT